MTFKETSSGSTVYILIKGDELKYGEGTLNSCSASRTEMPKTTDPMTLPQMRQVIDVTYTIDGQTVTDVCDASASVLTTSKFGGVAMVSVEKEAVLRELRETEKQTDNYLKDVPRMEKRLKKCRDLIGKLDVDAAEKQAMEKRLNRLERQSEETNSLIKEMMERMTKNKLF